MAHPIPLRGDGPAGRRFGRVLARYRKLAGISGRELARRAGLSSGFVSHLELGLMNPPTPQTLDLLAAALGCGRSPLYAAARCVPESVEDAYAKRPALFDAIAESVRRREVRATLEDLLDQEKAQ